MATIDDLRKIRLKKLEAIRKAGILAYPGKTKRTHEIEEALKDFSNLARLKKEVILGGFVHDGARTSEFFKLKKFVP